MELKDLTGTHEMRYVPRVDLQHPTVPSATGALFTLGDTTYLVFEDPADGYRSHAAPILSFKGDPYALGYEGRSPEHLPQGFTVNCSMMEGENDVLVVRDARGQIIFEIGTENTDDYYPMYIARWTPPAVA